jgi:hypothetical protein
VEQLPKLEEEDDSVMILKTGDLSRVVYYIVIREIKAKE